MTASRLAAALALAACGGSGASGPNGPAPHADPAAAGPTTTHVQPLSIQEPSRRSDQALILGTDSSGGSTTLPLAGDERKVEVDALYYITTTPPSGGSSPVWLSTAPQSDGQVRVGVYEQFSGGLGDSWRSAVWLAAFVGTSVLGKDLTDYKFTVEARGFVDGASAGGLFTAGFLAAITGAEVDETATMTGTVNPDGTIGPVGGIPQKFSGSIDQGKKRLGYPLGQRYSVDMATGNTVDLEELARSKGAEAFEIRDVYEAYELMTGKKLPQPVALDQREMSLSPEVNQRIKTVYESWQRLLAMHWDTILEVSRAGVLPPTLAGLAERAADEGRAAEKLLNEGVFATAYYRIMRATVYAATATTVWRIIKKAQAGDIDGALALFDKEFKTMERSINSLHTVAGRKPSTIGGYLLSVSAFQSAVAGLGFQMWGVQQVDRARGYLAGLRGRAPEDLASAETAEQVAAAIAVPVFAFTHGEAYARRAVEILDIESTDSLAFECSTDAAQRVAVSYSSAAAANLKYFESLTVDQLAKQMGLSKETMASRFGLLEPDYVVAQMALFLGLADRAPFAKELRDKWGADSSEWSLYMLSGSLLSYFKSSLLISQWYSLGVDKDFTSGRAKSVRHEKAFIYMIDHAEQRARAYAHAAKVAVGQVPLQARIHYQNARVLREGNLDEKLAALELFWTSSVYSQTAVVLARSQAAGPAGAAAAKQAKLHR